MKKSCEIDIDFRWKSIRIGYRLLSIIIDLYRKLFLSISTFSMVLLSHSIVDMQCKYQQADTKRTRTITELIITCQAKYGTLCQKTPGSVREGYKNRAYIRGTQRIVSVNHLFGRPLIPCNFLKIIFAWNFRDMGNLRPAVFGIRINKNVVSSTEKRSAKIFGKEIRLKVFGKWTKMS